MVEGPGGHGQRGRRGLASGVAGHGVGSGSRGRATLPVHEPFGAIENVVLDVTSPSELLPASKPCAVYACEPPAVIDALAG